MSKQVEIFKIVTTQHDLALMIKGEGGSFEIMLINTFEVSKQSEDEISVFAKAIVDKMVEALQDKFIRKVKAKDFEDDGEETDE